jgi:hypothetical protein
LVDTVRLPLGICDPYSLHLPAQRTFQSIVNNTAPFDNVSGFQEMAGDKHESLYTSVRQQSVDEEWAT